MRRSYQERGVALLLVLWLVAAMAVTVAGAMALAREEVSVTGSRLNEAKAFAIGKAVARLAILDRLEALESSAILEEDSTVQFGRVFSADYVIDGFTVRASVFPASGFVSLSEANAEIWAQLLVGLGGMSKAEAGQVAERIVETEMSAALGARRGGFGAIFAARLNGAGGGQFVEQLLSVEGMSRDIYDRIRRSVSPFGGEGGVVSSDAPPELQSVFGVANGEGMEQVSASDNQGGGFCVEVSFRLSKAEALSQRIWVQASDLSDAGGIQLVRVERPLPASGLGAG